MRIALIYGGRSAEHDVSVASATTIERVLRSRGDQVVPIAIDLEGRWFLQDGPVSPAIDRSRPVVVVPGDGLWAQGSRLAVDVAFPVTHGHQGEDGCLQGLLELAHVPYTGCDTVTSALLMYKAMAQGLLASAGVPTVPTLAWDRRMIDEAGWDGMLASCRKSCGHDLFIKPEDGGSSIGCTAWKADDPASFRSAVELALRYGERVLVQPLLSPIREVECAVLDDPASGLVVSPPGLIHDPADEELLSYTTKYRATGGDELLIPAPIPETTAGKIRAYAATAFRTAKGHGYARVDFFLLADGSILLNELNTLPGMTATSHYPALISHAGYTLEHVAAVLIDDALRHAREEAGRTYLPPGPTP